LKALQHPQMFEHHSLEPKMQLTHTSDVRTGKIFLPSYSQQQAALEEQDFQPWHVTGQMN
jgi:hypothetical protein